MDYTTIPYTELNKRMGDETVLQVLPLYTMDGIAPQSRSYVTAYVPVSDAYPVDVPYLEERLHAQWDVVEIVLVTDVPDAQIWKVPS